MALAEEQLNQSDIPTIPNPNTVPPNASLDWLLKQSDHPHVTVENFYADQQTRLDVIDQARLTWFNSNLKNKLPFDLMLLGHSYEAASEQPDSDFLRHSIGEVLKQTDAQPTYFHVVPQVMEIMPGPILNAMYLERMLAKPRQPLSGWVPVNRQDRELLDYWQQQITHDKVQAAINRLKEHEQTPRNQTS